MVNHKSNIPSYKSQFPQNETKSTTLKIVATQDELNKFIYNSTQKNKNITPELIFASLLFLSKAKNYYSYPLASFQLLQNKNNVEILKTILNYFINTHKNIVTISDINKIIYSIKKYHNSSSKTLSYDQIKIILNPSFKLINPIKNNNYSSLDIVTL